MTYTFRPAAYSPQPLLLAVAGPTGSGKTMSALILARGLVGDQGRIFGIDTENGRMLRYRQAHFKDRFRFEYCAIAAPFSPANYLGAMQAAVKGGADCVVIDSGTHEWAGVGGCADMHDELLEKMAGGVDWKMEKMSALAWKVPKREHKTMMAWTIQAPVHIIWCLRAEPKLKVVKVMEDGKEKTKYIDAGFQPICEKMFMYEMTASIMLSDAARGVPIPIKVPDELSDIFKTDSVITEEMGAKLRERNSETHAEKKAAATVGGAAAPLAGGKGRLALIAVDGSVVSNYANGTTWLAALKRALTDSSEADAAGKLWDRNSDLFYKIQAAATKQNDAKAIAACGEIGRLAIQKSTQGKQGELLGAAE